MTRSVDKSRILPADSINYSGRRPWTRIGKTSTILVLGLNKDSSEGPRDLDRMRRIVVAAEPWQHILEQFWRNIVQIAN
jgi:hypothetical protein